MSFMGKGIMGVMCRRSHNCGNGRQVQIGGDNVVQVQIANVYSNGKSPAQRRAMKLREDLRMQEEEKRRAIRRRRLNVVKGFWRWLSNVVNRFFRAFF